MIISRIRQFILNQAIKHLYKGLVPNDLLQVVEQNRKPIGLVIAGEMITDMKIIEAYRAEADKIKNSPLWEPLNKHLIYAAQKKVVATSTTTEHAIFGKSMIYNLELVNKYLDLLTKIGL